MVRWQSGERSENVEDRRRSGPSRAVVGGGWGLILMAILLLIITRGDIGKVLQFLVANNPGLQQGPPAQQPVDAGTHASIQSCQRKRFTVGHVTRVCAMVARGVGGRVLGGLVVW